MVIPKHISISNQAVVTHLNEYAPLLKEKWQEFTVLQGSADESLNPQAIDKLREIQGMIQVAFNGENKIIVEGMNPDAKQMVRSTGDEDRVDVANPGGNESVPSDSDSISSSIGIVISSYFSEKSMSQRLKSGEDITKSPPLMPCLIQELVGETLSSKFPPVSGVVYTDARNVRIQAAHGHGELVVNSKGNFDNFFVTNEDVVHQYIGDKKVRIIPKLNEQDNKLELEEVENTEFAKHPSLSEEQSMRLAKFSKFVQSKYGMRMDLEFVFDPNNNKINIVQARPIPEGKRRGVAPSALSNDFISREKPAHIDGEIITPDVMVTKAITSKDEVIICKSIDQALTSYLKSKDSKIKAVIIDKTAPDTSHEAGFFTSQAIPVIYADDYAKAENWVQNLEENNLVIDPQHSSIYQISKDQYQDSLIEEGIFRSSLAEHVTPIKREFAQGPINEFPVVKAKTIGELVIESRINPDATQKLFRFIQDETELKECKLYGEQEIKEDLKKLLTFPANDEEFIEQKETLANLLNFITSIKNEKEIASSTYEQLIITGLELYKSMKEVDANPQDAEIKLNYLNIHQKFNGLISSKGKSGILSTSLFNEIATHDLKKKLRIEVTQAGFDLSNVDESQFLNLARHKAHLINEEDRSKWLSFCYKECQTPERAEKLEALVNNIIELDLKDYWMNVNFLSKYEESKEMALPKLQAEYEQNLESSSDILKASKLIDRMEHQIGQWSEPKNFKKLFEKELQPKIEEITGLITFSEENKLSSNLASKQLYRLVDAIDLSIKQLQNSPLYEDKELQVQNFRLMLGEFFKVMESQVGEQHPDRIMEMKKFLQSKDSSNEEVELLPSENFSVIKADFFQDSGLGYGFIDVTGKSLADLYTLVHQTLLSSIGRKSIDTSHSLIKNLPKFLKEINDKILSERSINFVKSQMYSIGDKISFLYTENSFPHINLYYKIPLRAHSGTLKLEYNINTKTIKLDYTMFGIEQGNRWGDLEKSTFILLEAYTDVKLIEHKSDNQMFNFQIEINEDTKNIKEIFEIITSISTETNMMGRSFKSFIDETNLIEDFEKFGLSNFILNAHQDVSGNLDFKAMHKVLHELKNDPSNVMKELQEKEALIRLMAMDNSGVINYKKLEEIKEVISEYNDFNLSNIITDNIYQFTIPAYIIIADEFFKQKADVKTIVKIANLISSNNDVLKMGSNIVFGLNKIIYELIDKNYITEAFKLAERMSDEYSLVSIAYKLIDKNYPISEVLKLINNIDLGIRTSPFANKMFENNYTAEVLEILESVTSEYYLSEVLTTLIHKNYINESIKVAERLISNDGLIKIAYTLITKGCPTEAIELAVKITDSNYLTDIATKLIDHNYITEAIELAVKITDSNSLIDIAKKLIDHNYITEALELAERITDQDTILSIVYDLIEKGYLNEVTKVAERITDEDTIKNIVNNLIYNEHIINAVKVAEIITDPYYLTSIANYLIEEGYLNEVTKVAERITDQNYLTRIAKNLIKEGYPTEAVKIAKRITRDTDLNDIAFKLNEKNYPKEAVEVTNLVTIPMNLGVAYYKVSNMLSSFLPSLPVAAAIDESSYRSVKDDGYIVSEQEKQEHIKSKAQKLAKPFKDQTYATVTSYTDFVEQYNLGPKLPEYKQENPVDLLQNKLPEQDMMAAAVIAARGAKFFVNKLTAGKKSEVQERKKAKKSKKDIGR